MRVSLSRLVLSIFALAAFPALAQRTIYIPADYPTIQQGIDAANNGDAVQVDSSKTYYEHLTITDKSIELVGGDKMHGYATLDGSAGGPAISIIGHIASNSSVFGFTIQNAGKPQTTGGPHGAIYVSNSSPNLGDLHLSNNFCQGLNAVNSDAVFQEGSISGTLATGCPSEDGMGSAIRYSGTDPNNPVPLALIQKNILTGNTGSTLYSPDKGGGGAINITGLLAAEIDDNLITNNVSTGYGGAVYTAGTTTLYIIDNVIYNNKGLSGGLDIVIPGSSVGYTLGYLASNTIGYNTATSKNAGSDLYIGGNLAQYQLVNNIFVGSENGEVSVNCGNLYAGQTITPLVLDHNDFYSLPSSTNTPVGGACTNPAGTHGNISADPLFVDASSSSIANGQASLQVQAGSPVIDAGNNSGQAFNILDVADDYAGMLRYFDATGKGYATIDLGAYEYNSPVSDGNEHPDQLTQAIVSPLDWSPNAGNTITFNATLLYKGAANALNGTYSLYEDGALVATSQVVPYVAGLNDTQIHLANVTAGLHQFYLTYTNDSSYVSSTSVYIYILVGTANTQPTQTDLISSLNPSNVGDSVTFTAHVHATSGTSQPTGSVTFTDGNVILATVALNAGGDATYTTSTLAAGNHPITAGYPATGNFGASASSVLEQQVSTKPALTSSQSVLTVAPSSAVFGSPITLTATVTPASPAPTGTVTFFSDGQQIGSAALSAGTAKLQTMNLSAGTHSLTCSYAGDSTYTASNCNPAAVTIGQASTAITLTSSANPSPALTPITFTTTLTNNSLPGNPPAAGVTMHFSVDGIAQASTPITDANGKATLTLTLAAGSHQVAVTDGITTNYLTSTMALTESVTPNPTSLTMLVAPNPAYQSQTANVAITIASLAGASTANGSVSLLDSGKVIATKATAASSLVCATPGPTCSPSTTVNFALTNLTVGDHILTATYTPDLNFLASATTASTTLTIKLSSFTLTANPTALSVQTQHHTALTLTVASIGNFSGGIYLACTSTLPPVLKCEFAQSQLQLAVNGTASTRLTLETDAINNFYPASFGRNALLTLLTLFPLTLLAFRKRRGFATLALLALATLALTTGCSGHYPDHTPAGTYDIAITATGGTAQPQTAHVTLTVTVTP